MKRRIAFLYILKIGSWIICFLIIAHFFSNYQIWKMIQDTDMTFLEGVVERSHQMNTHSAHYAYHYVDSVPASRHIRYYSNPHIFLRGPKGSVNIGNSGNLSSPLVFEINPNSPLDITSTKLVFILTELSYVAFLVLLFLVLRWLVRIFNEMRSGQFFTRKHHQLIRRIGFVVMAMPIVDELILRIVFDLVRSNTMLDASFGSLYVVPAFDFPTFFVGIAIVILSEAFRYGSELQYEQNLTV